MSATHSLTESRKEDQRRCIVQHAEAWAYLKNRSELNNLILHKLCFAHPRHWGLWLWRTYSWQTLVTGELEREKSAIQVLHELPSLVLIVNRQMIFNTQMKSLITISGS